MGTRTAPPTFADLLQHYRRAAGLTQEALAERAHLSARGISNLERGVRRLPQRGTLTLLIEALGLAGAERAAFEAAARGLDEAAAADHPPLPVPTNLPLALTSFVGRASELVLVRDLLGETRLLTLTGAGGCGKTRLALEVARALTRAAGEAAAYADGIWLVELAALAGTTAGGAALVPQAVAQALGLHEESGRPLLATLAAQLQPKALLLVLDNCEHLIGACAELAAALLRACPHLRLLATSRAALEVPGETLYRVPSLAAPDPAQLPPPERLPAYEAVALFVARARARRSAFALTARNAPAVAAVCARLDGIPLALELAAARVSVLPVEGIAARLDDRFRLLSGGPRTALPRQQTLRATLDWSHDLLSEPEQVLLRRLAVFAGGWALDAAEAVCVGVGIEACELLDLLGSLVNKSLVLLEEWGPDGEQGRYRLLETVRQYGLERLAAAGEGAAVRGRHLGWCLALAEEEAAQLTGPQQGIWLARLDAEHDNLRAALAWARQSDQAERGLHLASLLQRFWDIQGYLREGRTWLEELYEQAPPDLLPARARAARVIGVLVYRQAEYGTAATWFERSSAMYHQLGAGFSAVVVQSQLANVALEQGLFDRAVALYEECLSFFRSIEHTWHVASTLNNLGEAMRLQGAFARAAVCYDESLALYHRLEDTWSAASVLNNLGELAYQQGEYQRAAALSEESLTLNRQLGERQSIAPILLNLGNVAYRQGTYQRARTLYLESLAAYRRRDDPVGIARCLDGLALVAAMDGRREQAARMLGAAAALRISAGAVIPPANRARYDADLAGVRAAMTPEAFQAAWKIGQNMDLRQAIDEMTTLAAGSSGAVP
jgi:non-specific serine/threonine protein kinase